VTVGQIQEARAAGQPPTYQAAMTEMATANVPPSIAQKYLNTIFPITQRPISAQAIQDHNQTVGIVSSKNGGGFVPKGVAVTIGRADQGRDIQIAPGAPIVAPGAGYVVSIKSDPGSGGAHFGPSYPVVHFTSGPYAGMTVYIGHTTAALKVGQKFKAGTVISLTGNGGPESGGAPPGWAEIGFAPGGSPGKFGQAPPF